MSQSIGYLTKLLQGGDEQTSHYVYQEKEWYGLSHLNIGQKFDLTQPNL